MNFEFDSASGRKYHEPQINTLDDLKKYCDEVKYDVVIRMCGDEPHTITVYDDYLE
jgi:hypothetical protein